VAGLLAAHCLDTRATPQQVSNDESRTQVFQRLLDDHGVERRWPTLRPL
jgi:hypothetical protein